MQELEVNETIVSPTSKEAYVVVSVLGEGASGGVYKIRDCANRYFALKSIRVGRDQIKREAADKELELLRKFSHPHIISFYEQMHINGVTHIKMELASDSLRSYVQKKPDKTLGPDELQKVMHDVASALEYVHKQKVIHRDIKPENVLLVGGDWKICDFGVSSLEDLGQTFVGTSPYLASEIINCREDGVYTEAVDIWALGVMMFECYFRAYPFLPKPLERLVMAQDFLRFQKNMIEVAGKGFKFEKVLKIYRDAGKNDEATYIEVKLKDTEEALKNLFKEIFQLNPDHRMRAEGILRKLKELGQLKEPKKPWGIRIRSVSQQQAEMPVEPLLLLRHPESNRPLHQPNILEEIVFLTETITLLKGLFKNPGCIEYELGSLEYILFKRFKALPEQVHYVYAFPEIIKQLQKLDRQGKQASKSIRTLLHNRMCGLKLNTESRRDIKELMFRLLMCSVWEDLMPYLEWFVKKFYLLFPCIRGEELQAIERYAKKGVIEPIALETIDFELKQKFTNEK